MSEDLAPLGVLLSAIAAGDLALSLSRGAPLVQRLAGLGATFVTAIAGLWLIGAGEPPWFILILLAFAHGSWLMIRADTAAQSPSQSWWRRPECLLALHAAVLVLLAFVGSTGWTGDRDSPFATWLESNVLLSSHPPGEVLFAAGALAYLTSTANVLVRILLRLTLPTFTPTDSKVRAGRVIGVLERWFILGFLIAGEPAGAALVLSAKALLRLPEMRSADQPNAVDPLSEYVVVGSMLSWILAFGAGAVFALR